MTRNRRSGIIGFRLSESAFARLVDRAIAGIPDRFAPYLKDVVIDIEQAPSRAECDEVGIDDPRDLLGFYCGTPRTERGIETEPMLPDRIVIYQRNIERVCKSEDDIVREVRVTVLHEIGHFFGLDEDELEDLGY